MRRPETAKWQSSDVIRANTDVYLRQITTISIHHREKRKGERMSDQNLFSGEMTEKQRLFREEYKENIAKWYSGWGHLLSIYVPGIAVIAFFISRIENLNWLEI